MKKQRVEVIVLDKSYPVFSELLGPDNWKLVRHNKLSTAFMPMESLREQRIMLKENLTPKLAIFKQEIAEKTEEL